jgi:hypothetical protein
MTRDQPDAPHRQPPPTTAGTAKAAYTAPTLRRLGLLRRLTRFSF